VLTVVPDPHRMMSEMIRVCKLGGRIAMTTHFQSSNPVVAAINSLVNPITRHLGWTTKLRKKDVLTGPRDHARAQREDQPLVGAYRDNRAQEFVAQRG